MGTFPGKHNPLLIVTYFCIHLHCKSRSLLSFYIIANNTESVTVCFAFVQEFCPCLLSLALLHSSSRPLYYFLRLRNTRRTRRFRSVVYVQFQFAFSFFKWHGFYFVSSSLSSLLFIFNYYILISCRVSLSSQQSLKSGGLPSLGIPYAYCCSLSPVPHPLVYDIIQSSVCVSMHVCSVKSFIKLHFPTDAAAASS